MGETINYRQIVVPLAPTDYRLTITYPHLNRIRPVLDYVKTDKRWLIEVQVESNIDWALFERYLKHSPIQVVAYRGELDTDIRLFVIDSRLPDDGSHVRRWGEEELPRINAGIASYFPSFVPAMYRSVIELLQTVTPGRFHRLYL